MKEKKLKKRIAELEDRVEELEDQLDAMQTIERDYDVDAILEAFGHVLALVAADPASRQAIYDKCDPDREPYDYDADVEAIYNDYDDVIDDEEFDEMCSRIANVEHAELVSEFEDTILDAVVDAFDADGAEAAEIEEELYAEDEGEDDEDEDENDEEIEAGDDAQADEGDEPKPVSVRIVVDGE